MALFFLAQRCWDVAPVYWDVRLGVNAAKEKGATSNSQLGRIVETLPQKSSKLDVTVYVTFIIMKTWSIEIGR